MKKDIRPYNDKGQIHGLWEMYDNDGDVLLFKVFYINGQLNGYHEHSYKNIELIFHI